MIKQSLMQVIAEAVRACRSDGTLALPDDALPPITIDVPPDPRFGDYTTNIAVALAKIVRKPPGLVADAIAKCLQLAHNSPLERAQAAPTGFINFWLAPGFLGEALRTLVQQEGGFGRGDDGDNTHALVEFVSANPHSPLTVLHGRGAALGDTLASLFQWTGHDVSREFYVNDVTNRLQTKTFARSAWVRYRQLLGHDDPLPDDGHGGAYVTDIARAVLLREGNRYENPSSEEASALWQQVAADEMQVQQQAALHALGVRFDTWFREATLHTSKAVEAVIEALKARDHARERDGALWLSSTRFGDDKDRVLVRDAATPDARTTYMASDLAYHQNKSDRGFERWINVWSADHAGYVARTRAGVAALGLNPDRLEVIVYASVRLFKDGQEVKSGKRAGNQVLLEDLLDEVGKDAARFFLLRQAPGQEIDLDLDLAKQQNKDNPFYCLQNAYVRCRRLQAEAEHQLAQSGNSAVADLALLTHPAEIALLKKLTDFPDEVRQAAQNAAPNRLCRYVSDLANRFHEMDEHNTEKQADAPDRVQARLFLLKGTNIVLSNAFSILGIDVALS